MGGPGSGRYERFADPNGIRFARREQKRAVDRARKRIWGDDAPTFNFSDRNPDREVVKGLKRSDFQQFLMDVIAVRNGWISHKTAIRRNDIQRLKRGRK